VDRHRRARRRADAQGRQGSGGRVVAYTHKDPERVARSWAGEHLHRGTELELYSMARPFLTELVARLKRRMVFALSVTGGHLYTTIDGDVIEGQTV
jgi:YaeQ protein